MVKVLPAVTLDAETEVVTEKTALDAFVSKGFRKKIKVARRRRIKRAVMEEMRRTFIK